MRRVVISGEMAALDRYTIDTIGVPGIVLMERAALAVACHVRQACPDRPVLIACGPGNNGGDGLAVARILHLWGASVKCYAPEKSYRGDALINFTAAGNTGVCFIEGMEAFRAAAAEPCVLVDALFGTGIGRDITGVWAEIVEAINACGKTVISVDIPSGIDGETGHIRGCAVKASRTVTFQWAKAGHYLYPGREHAGELIIADIGIVENGSLCRPRRVLESEDAALPRRRPNSHKGDYGHVAVIAGSLGMLGAGALASGAAMRGGAGLATWIVPESLAITASALVKEAMICPVPDEGGRLTAGRSQQAVFDALKGKSAAVIGPGISRNNGVVALIRNILHTIDIPIVLDADGLFAISGYPERMPAGPCVLTPHPGEMARLMGCTIAEVEDDPLGVARRCAGRYEATVVLKGSTTLIASDGEVTFNLTGNPGMATGGSGDVLAGLTAALLAQGMPVYEAASRACYLHGKAGDAVARRRGMAGVVAGDIVECLPMVSGGDEPD